MLLAVVFQNRVAYGDALVTNIRPRIVTWGRDEFPDYILALMAKRTSQCFVGTGSLHTLAPAGENPAEP